MYCYGRLCVLHAPKLTDCEQKLTNHKKCCVAEIGLLIYPDCQLSAVHGLTDLFRVASERGGLTQNRHIRVSHWEAGIDNEVGCSWDSHPDKEHHLDYAMVPPSIQMPQNMRPMSPEANWLERVHSDGSRVCSICAGAFVVAESGVLSGRRVTTHWAFASQLADKFPDILVDERNMVIDDGDIISAGGILAWTDLGLKIVERLLGPTAMLSTARFLVVQPPRRLQQPFSEFIPSLTHGDSKMLNIQHHINAHADSDLDVSSLSIKAGLGERTFMRRFRVATGLTVNDYVQKTRVEKAKGMLEQTLKTVEVIAWEVGYKDPSSFRRLFKKITGSSPQAYRDNFGIGSNND